MITHGVPARPAGTPRLIPRLRGPPAHHHAVLSRCPGPTVLQDPPLRVGSRSRAGPSACADKYREQETDPGRCDAGQSGCRISGKGGCALPDRCGGQAPWASSVPGERGAPAVLPCVGQYECDCYTRQVVRVTWKVVRKCHPPRGHRTGSKPRVRAHPPRCAAAGFSLRPWLAPRPHGHGKRWFLRSFCRTPVDAGTHRPRAHHRQVMFRSVLGPACRCRRSGARSQSSGVRPRSPWSATRDPARLSWGPVFSAPTLSMRRGQERLFHDGLIVATAAGYLSSRDQQHTPQRPG